MNQWTSRIGRKNESLTVNGEKSSLRTIFKIILFYEKKTVRTLLARKNNFLFSIIFEKDCYQEE